MASSPALQFATDEGLNAFERSMSGFFWAQDFTGAERLLGDASREHPSAFSDICQATSQNAVSISGWDELYAQIEELARNGSPCTAIEIDLSGHADRKVGPDGALEPGFECSYYDDSIFRFSAASREEILSQCKTGRREWQGGFEEIDHALTCDGLGTLYSSLAKYEHRHWRPLPAAPDSAPADVPRDFVAFKLAQWFLYLRVHTAVCSDLRTRGLPHRMPVVIGQHDFGPYLSSVYMPETICDSRDSTDRILARRQAEARAWYDEMTEKDVSGLRERRDGIRSWPFFVKRSERKIYIEYSAAYENHLVEHYKLAADRPTWKMSNQEFEAFIERFRATRNTRYGASAR